MNHPEWLTLDETASMLNIGVPTVQTLINRGFLTTSDRAGEPKIAYADVVEFMRRDQQTLREQGHQPADLGMIPDDTE